MQYGGTPHPIQDVGFGDKADFFPMTLGWDGEAQQRTHLANWIRPGQPGDNMQEHNREYIYHDEQLSGYEAYDYQNPYVWQGRNLLTVSTLIPGYGIFSDTPANVARNISMSGGILAK